MEFHQRFPTEQACWDYLYQLRWPNGFVCRRCGGKKAWKNVRGVTECGYCGYQTSLTAGTVLEKTRKPLQEWFTAMWWICTQKTGGSAQGLQHLLELGSYKTAWTWLHKLRLAMVRADREPLSGTVEVDDGFIGGEEEAVKGRQTVTKTQFVLAVEIPCRGRTTMGRIRMKQIEDFSSQSLRTFIRDNIALGSDLVTDGWKGYAGLKSLGYDHRVIPSNPELLPNVHLVIALLKRWLLGTHQGAVQLKHVQAYFDEFTFRHNRRKSHHVGKIFYRLAQGAVSTETKSLKELLAN